MSVHLHIRDFVSILWIKYTGVGTRECSRCFEYGLQNQAIYRSFLRLSIAVILYLEQVTSPSSLL